MGNRAPPSYLRAADAIPHRLPAAGARNPLLSPRALGRRRLPARPEGRANTAGRAHLLRGRRLARAALPKALPRGLERRRSAPPPVVPGRLPVRPRRRRRLLLHVALVAPRPILARQNVKNYNRCCNRSPVCCFGLVRLFQCPFQSAGQRTRARSGHSHIRISDDWFPDARLSPDRNKLAAATLHATRYTAP